MLSSDEEDNAPLVRQAIEARNSECLVRDWSGYLVSVGLVIFGITCITVVCLYHRQIEYEYGIVLDAGSSHTDMFIYKWKVSDVFHGTALVEEIGNCTVTDSDGNVTGISSYVKDPSQAGESLKSCINNKARKLIPSYLQDKSPIYLGATAGMRLLNETNPDVSDKILVSVRQTLQDSSFKFEDSYAGIISGTVEGLSSWVTVNYLHGSLLYSPVNSNTDNSLDSKQNTSGALDMGGASTQITFVPKLPEQSTKLNTLRLYGKDYSIYTHSYLCYGKKEAERRFLAQLVKEANYSAAVDNPCGPKDYNTSQLFSYLGKHPCVPELPPMNWTSVTFRGTGNYSLCSKQVAKLFDFESCQGRANCSFDGTYQPPVDALGFFAFSSYYNIIKDLNLTSNASLVELEAAAKNICLKSWNEIKVIPGLSKFVLFYCFDAQYVFTILSRGYHFNNTGRNIKFVKSVHGRSLGWALGFMINATKLLPVEPPGYVYLYRFETSVFLVVVIVGALLISLGLIVLTLSVRRMRQRNMMRVGGLVL